jgi:aryl-alcohol dehydrogenase-like predicted oxidoreductase
MKAEETMAKPDDHGHPTGRRDFLKLGAAVTAGALTQRAGAAPRERAPGALPVPTTMPTRNLGRTGHRVGLFSLGGQAAVEQPDNHDVAVPIVERALDLGINYIDTSARYGGVEERWSERYIGQVMKRRRAEAFLATKTHDRTRDGSLRLLERSLELLNTDHIDLWQVHNLARMSQVDEIFAEGGAVEAMVEARDQGIVRFLGITGHADPEVLIAAIERFEFDTVLMALNAADRHRLSFRERLLDLAVGREMGIIGMKIPARGRILSSWTPPPPEEQRPWMRASGPGTIEMSEAMRYVLSLPVSTVIVGCDSLAQLEENVEIANTFTPLGDDRMAELEARTEPIADQALFFRRKGS